LTNEKPSDTTEKTSEQISINSLISEVSSENIIEWINTLSCFRTRHTKSKLINKVAEWLKAELHNLGYTNVQFHNYFKYSLLDILNLSFNSVAIFFISLAAKFGGNICFKSS
jgi:hypothetical protein